MAHRVGWLTLVNALSHAVVAYPRLNPPDAAWIDSIRERHDPQAGLIQAHFTLVFPVPVAATVLIAAARRATSGCRSFRIRLTQAVAQRDETAGSGSHVFLTPSEGGKEISRLHDVLYHDELKPYLRPGIAYVPHLTVGAKVLHADCVALADALNQRAISIGGTIEQIEVVAVSVERVTGVAAFNLEHFRKRLHRNGNRSKFGVGGDDR